MSRASPANFSTASKLHVLLKAGYYNPENSSKFGHIYGRRIVYDGDAEKLDFTAKVVTYGIIVDLAKGLPGIVITVL